MINPKDRATLNPKQRAELAERVEKKRRELGDRPDISQAMRKLSASSGRNPIGPLPKKRSTLLTLILGAVAAVVMLTLLVTAIAVTAGGFWLQKQLNDPTATVDQFYSALHLKDYHSAYSYLSESAQHQLSESQFTTLYSGYDQLGGIVQTYTVKTSAVNGATATVNMAIVRRGDSSTQQVQTLTLTQENGNWRISAIVLGTTEPAATPSS